MHARVQGGDGDGRVGVKTMSTSAGLSREKGEHGEGELEEVSAWAQRERRTGGGVDSDPHRSGGVRRRAREETAVRDGVAVEHTWEEGVCVLERGKHGASRETKRERNGGLVPRQPSPEHHGVEQEIELQGLGWVFSASAEEGGVVCEFCGGRRGELGCPGFKRERGWLTVNRARAR
jgi:hypothetical protein